MMKPNTDSQTKESILLKCAIQHGFPSSRWAFVDRDYFKKLDRFMEQKGFLFVIPDTEREEK